MTLTNRIGRPLLAGIFIAGGIDQLRNAGAKAPLAQKVSDDLDEIVDDNPLPDDPELLVQINGGVQVAAGALLALNKIPRIASLALAATLVPTTLGSHRFWEADDPEERQAQQVQFLKNLGLFGGLLIAAGDTGGQPSLAYRARHAFDDSSSAAQEAGTAIAAASGTVGDRTADVVDDLGDAVGDLLDELREVVSDVDLAGLVADARPVASESLSKLRSDLRVVTNQARDLARSGRVDARQVAHDVARAVQAHTV